MTASIQKLPLELLVEIFVRLPSPDIARLKRVNRAFYGFITSSPLIQHGLDLHVAGFEYNPMAGVNLTEGRKAFHEYLSNLDSFTSFTETRVDGILAPANPKFGKIVGDVHAVMGDSLLLFILESTSLGMPYKEWEVSLPPISIGDYSFCPDADIIAFSGQEPQGDRKKAVIHLRSLSSGEHHPAAQHPIIECRTDAVVTAIPSTSISDSRLAVLIKMENSTHMVIWDWKSAEVLYRLENERYTSAEFVDDYRLLALLKVPGDDFYDPPPRVLLISTEKGIGGVPAQTSFHLPPYFSPAKHPTIRLERGGHKPSPTDRLTPFYQDPTQRIAVLDMRCPLPYLAFPVEALVGLSRDHEGHEIEWDGWKKHAIIPSIEPGPADTWVSGCRLYHLKPNPNAVIKIYDFSVRGRVGRLGGWNSPDLGVMKCLQSTGAELTFESISPDLHVLGGRRESFMFFYLIGEYDDDEPESGLHIWSF